MEHSTLKLRKETGIEFEVDANKLSFEDQALALDIASLNEPKAFRTWTDANRGKTVVAAMIYSADEFVVIERRNGFRMRIPLELLSEADIQFVESNRRTNATNIDDF